MADSDEEPASNSAPASGAPPPLPEEPQPLPKIPRATPSTLAQRREGGAAEQGIDPDISLEELLNWARAFDGPAAAAAAPKTEKAKSQRSQISREKRKFRKFDPEAPKEEELPEAELDPSGAQEADDAPGDEEEDFEDDSEEGSAVAEDPRRGLRRTKEAPRSLLSSLVVQGLVLILMGASFLLGRETVPVNAPAAIRPPPPVAADSDKTPSILSAASMEMIDRAIVAENTGDYRTASSLFDQLRHTSSHIEGLDYHLAWLSYRSGDYPSAMLLLNRSLAINEEVGGCYGLRGLIASQRRPGKGLGDFEAATQAAPFDPLSFFYWGEALRRSGKLQAALIHLRQAADRARSPAERATDALKMRLTQIELGQAKELDGQIEAEMALKRPPPEWVLTAAARDMQSGNFAAAAVDLNEARQLMDRTAFALALRDYFFLGFVDQPALTHIFAEILPPSALVPAAAHPGGTPAAAAASDIPLTLTPLPVPVEVAPPAAPAP